MIDSQHSPNAPLLVFDEICKSFFGVRVLENISLVLQRGEVLGLVGENGAGKSTLMNVLGGVLQPDSGSMLLDEEHFAPENPAESVSRGISLIHQELNLFANLSVAENLFLDRLPRRRLGGLRLPIIDRSLLHDRAAEVLAVVGLAVDPGTLVETLSPGERQLVEISRALAGASRIILFDEPTTSLTDRESEKLFGLIDDLKARGISIVYISHDLDDVFKLSDRVAVLRDGAVVALHEAVVAAHGAVVAAHGAVVAAHGAVVAAHGERAFDLDVVISQMVGREISQLFPSRKTLPGERILLEAREISRDGVLQNVALRLHEGEVLGLSGLMGSGRTELARVLFGLDKADAGVIELEGERVEKLSPRERIKLGLAYLTEDRREEGLLGDAGVQENMTLASLETFRGRGGFLDRGAMAAASQAVADSVRIAGVNIDRQAVKTLSGGNQQKVVLARWLLRKANVFLLDEPTRGIDVGARYEVYRIIDQLSRSGAAVLLISSDLEELIGLCDRILVMQAGRIRAEFSRENFDREAILRLALGGGDAP